MTDIERDEMNAAISLGLKSLSGSFALVYIGCQIEKNVKNVFIQRVSNIVLGTGVVVGMLIAVGTSVYPLYCDIRRWIKKRK